MFPQRSAFVWTLLGKVFTTLIWTRCGYSAALPWVGRSDLDIFQYDDDAAMIREQDFREALDNCVTGDHP